jgi:hypothetical protein
MNGWLLLAGRKQPKQVERPIADCFAVKNLCFIPIKAFLDV